MTNRRIENILFDSEIHDWSQENNQFNKILNGKKDIIVLIEDEKQNLFGGYIGNEIQTNENLKDETCYVFSLRKNGIYRKKRYFRNEKGSSCRINTDEKITSFGFGIGNDNGLNDICIFKKECGEGYCQQECYDYQGESNALTGKSRFNIKRIVVYQLQ